MCPSLEAHEPCVGELAVYLTLRLFPTDVAIVGLAAHGAVMAGVVVGALCGWRG